MVTETKQTVTSSAHSLGIVLLELRSGGSCQQTKNSHGLPPAACRFASGIVAHRRSGLVTEAVTREIQKPGSPYNLTTMKGTGALIRECAVACNNRAPT